ncbi:unannotated protein [freshwater metagenome]|uniref:Unannotated protein n=1 Tax=freshwater metagenome TaxID=449393 RepID=A0A6J5Z2X8_9ZZZZ
MPPPRAEYTTTSLAPSVSCEGASIVIDVAEFSVTLAHCPPTVTPGNVLPKFEPVIVMTSPPDLPVVEGETVDTTGLGDPAAVMFIVRGVSGAPALVDGKIDTSAPVTALTCAGTIA